MTAPAPKPAPEPAPLRRRRLLRGAAEAEADVRPTLLGVVTLMFLLLFFLLTTSSGQRLGTVDLRLGSASDLAPLPHNGLLKEIRVTMHGDAFTVALEVQSTDISAAATTVERRVHDIPPVDGRPDLAALRAAVEEAHGIDPSQERARLVPEDATTTAQILAAMDVLRGPELAPLFPRVTLAGADG